MSSLIFSIIATEVRSPFEMSKAFFLRSNQFLLHLVILRICENYSTKACWIPSAWFTCFDWKILFAEYLSSWNNLPCLHEPPFHSIPCVFTAGKLSCHFIASFKWQGALRLDHLDLQACSLLLQALPGQWPHEISRCWYLLRRQKLMSHIIWEHKII